MIDMNLLQSFKTQKEIVRYLLEKFPESRKNANALIGVYMREIYGIDIKPDEIEFMEKATSLRTIVRVRVKLSNDGVYPFTDDVIRENTFREAFKKK